MRDIVHQARAGGWPKTHRDLVHRKRRNKGLRDIVHKARAGGWSKTHRDLVQKERRYKVLRVIVHQVLSRRLAENSPGLGAKGTEAQGFTGYRAPSPEPPV